MLAWPSATRSNHIRPSSSSLQQQQQSNNNTLLSKLVSSSFNNNIRPSNSSSISISMIDNYPSQQQPHHFHSFNNNNNNNMKHCNLSRFDINNDTSFIINPPNDLFHWDNNTIPTTSISTTSVPVVAPAASSSVIHSHSLSQSPPPPPHAHHHHHNNNFNPDSSQYNIPPLPSSSLHPSTTNTIHPGINNNHVTSSSSVLNDIWSTVALVQSEILDDDPEGVIPFGNNDNHNSTSLLPSSYAINIVHEVLVRPDDTSAPACFIDLGRHVARLVKMQDMVIALLEFNGSKNRISNDCSPLIIEQVADKLLAVINEILYTTRPRDATRVRYMRADLASDRPFAVFIMFSRLVERLTESQATNLVNRLPFSLLELVQLRNAVVIITERVRCAKEIHL